MKQDKDYLLYGNESNEVEVLFNIYREDPYKARIYYFNDRSKFHRTRLTLFEKDNGEFSIVLFRRNFGISVTNKMYHREKRELEIHYSKGKLWYKRGQLIRNLEIQHLLMFNDRERLAVERYLNYRFPWYEFYKDVESEVKLNLNKIISKKLFTYKKLVTQYYLLPYNIYKAFKAHELKCRKDYRLKHVPLELIRSYRKYLINIESLTVELATNEYFSDTLTMCLTLDKTINCSWSPRRLKEEHDNWSREITNVIYENMPNSKLSVNSIFIDFASYSGYQLFRESRDLVMEGKKQSHCVATYVKNVNTGQCAIYHIDNYTLELQILYNAKSEKNLFIAQFRGFRNTKAPKELFDAVNFKLDNFNNRKKKSSIGTVEEKAKDYQKAQEIWL